MLPILFYFILYLFMWTRCGYQMCLLPLPPVHENLCESETLKLLNKD